MLQPRGSDSSHGAKPRRVGEKNFPHLSDVVETMSRESGNLDSASEHDGAKPNRRDIFGRRASDLRR